MQKNPIPIITPQGEHQELPPDYRPRPEDYFKIRQEGKAVAAGPWSRFPQALRSLTTNDYQFRFRPYGGRH